MTFDQQNLSFRVQPTNFTSLGLHRVKVTLNDSKDLVNYFINFWVNDYPLDDGRLTPEEEEDQTIEPEEDDPQIDNGGRDAETVDPEDETTDSQSEQAVPLPEPDAEVSQEEVSEEKTDFFSDQDTTDQPQTRTSDFDPSTLWAVKKLKERVQQSQAEFMREYQQNLALLEPPIASIRSINQIGEVRVVFN